MNKKLKVGSLVKCISGWPPLITNKFYRITQVDGGSMFWIAEYAGAFVLASPWEGRVYPGLKFSEIVDKEDKTELFQFLRAEMHG